jgi:hypothetical protein
VGTSISIPGSGKVDITVFGRGTVLAGNGNDKIDITGQGKIVVGSGHDTLTLGKGGTIIEHGASGHDTIHIGSTGNYTIVEQGRATVSGAFGHATISGGTLEIIQQPGHAPREIAISGHITLVGSSGTTTTAGSAGHTSTAGSSGHTSTAGSAGHTPTTGTSGHDTTAAGAGGHNLFNFHPQEKGNGQHLIQNFLSGQDYLVIHGPTVPFTMHSPHDISAQGANTVISMHGGSTTIELHGVKMNLVDGGKH